MELQITTRNDVELSEALQEYLEKKIGKMDRYLPTIVEGKVEISREGTRRPDQRYSVQVTLDSKGVLIRAQERSDDIRTAVDRVVDVLTKRIERYKGKLYDKGKGVSLARQGTTMEEQEVETPRRIVKDKHFLVKPMPVDEAVTQMELLGHDFFLFTDADTDRINLLYRRKDGDYGLIEAEHG